MPTAKTPDDTIGNRVEEVGSYILTLSSDLICIAGMDGYFKYVNPAWERTLGYTTEQLLARPFLDFIHPDDHHKNDEEVAKLASGKLTVGFENRYVHKDGSVRTFNWTATPMPDKKLMYCIGRDITERKRAEEVLRESEERYRSLFEQAVDSIILFDPATTAMVDFNDAACRHLGYTREEFAKLKVSDIEAVESAKEVKRHIRAVVSEGQTVFETKHRTKAGAILDFEIRSKAVRIAGRVLLQNICRDITGRKRAEEVLRESEDLFKTFFDIANVGLSITQLSGEMRVNKAICNMLGYSKEELEHLKWQAITHPDDVALTQGVISRLLSGKEDSSRFLKRFVHKTGSVVWADLHSTLQRDAAGRPLHLVTALIDVTDRKLAETALQNSEQALKEINETLEKKIKERTTKLKALTAQLVRAEEQERQRIAHILHDDLQQMITGARLLLGVLRKRHPAERAKSLTDSIMHILDQAAQVTRTLAVDLRLPVLYEAGLLAALKWLANDVKEKCDLAVQVRIDKAVEPESRELRVFIFEAVRELLLNVVKHAGVKKAQVALSVAEGGQVKVEVIDRGKGFDALQSPSDSFGLFSLRERAESFGGELNVSSAPGKGTSVTLKLPKE